MLTGTYNRLRVHVWASDRQVIRALRKKLNPAILKGRGHRERRLDLYREVLAIHRGSQGLYVRVQQGDLS